MMSDRLSSSLSSTTACYSPERDSSSIRNSKLDRIKLQLDKHEVFGRDMEQMELARIPRRCDNGPQVVVVHGKQGSGKTSLIHSMEQTWTSNDDNMNALYVSATFDKHEVHSSAGCRSALVDALEDLCRAWALTPNGKIEIDEYLERVDEQEEVFHRAIPILYNKEEETWCCKINSPDGKTCLYRKKLAIKILLDSICRPSRPVILFLDDFQFADEPSLDILNFILHSDMAPRGLVLVVAYRDESPLLQPVPHLHEECAPTEADDQINGHPPHHGIQAIETWKTANTNNVHDIPVQNLCIFGVNEMILGLLDRPDDTATMSLAEVIFHKTGGNPFCICQFLRLLQDEGFLFYSLSKYQWEWTDVDQIQTATSIMSQNVADVIAASIQRLSPETQEALMVASCLGKRIPFQILSQFFSNEKQENSTEFSESANNSLSAQKVNATSLEGILDSAVRMEVLTKRHGATTYYWSHEHVRETVYRLISKDRRANWHLHLGQVAWKMRSSHPKEEWLVYLAREQFSKLTPLVSKKSMRVSLTKLNLEAAQLCISQSALHPAGRMLHEGINLLNPETRWEEHYDLCIAIYTILAETAHALGNHEASKRAIDSVLRHAKTERDKSRVNFALVQSLAAHRDYDGAIDKTIDLLADGGMRIRPNPIKPHILALHASLPRNCLVILSELPIMTDERTMLIDKLLSHLAMFALNAERMALAELAVLECYRLCIHSGISTYTATALAVQGLILMHQGKIEQAQIHGHLALSMLQQFEDNPGEFQVRTVQMIYSGIINAVKPFHESLDVFMKAHHMGLATRDLEHSLLGGMHYSLCYLAVGLPLTPLESDVGTFTEESKQFGLGSSIGVNFQIFRQTILNLQGKAASLTVLKGEAIDAETYLSEMQGDNLLLVRRDVATFQLMLACIYDDMDMAERMLDVLEPFPFTDLVAARGHIRLMFMGIAGFALGRKSGRHFFRYLSIARKALKHFELAAKHGSVNAHPVLEFLRGEEAPSKEAYDKAIRTCARSGLTHLQAMVNERAGHFFLDQSEQNQAIFYLSKAELLYLDWGATGKVAQLRHKYSFLSSVSDELHQKCVSVGLKGRKRVSMRDTAAIHEYNDFNSLRCSESQESLFSINRSSRRNCRNSTLRLSELELSFGTKHSNAMHLSRSSHDCFDFSLSSMDNEPVSIAEVDEDDNPPGGTFQKRILSFNFGRQKGRGQSTKTTLHSFRSPWGKKDDVCCKSDGTLRLLERINFKLKNSKK